MLNVLMLCLFFFIPAQQQDPSVLVDGVVYSGTETSGTATTIFIDEDGKLVTQQAHYGNGDDAQGQAPTPVLTTTWTDTNGVVQTVSTPVASTTPAGQRSAVATHEALVSAMQALHPVRHP